MSKAIAEIIASTFPFWEKLDTQTKTDFLTQGQHISLSAGQFICLEGDICDHNLKIVRITHEAIAQELGSSREVISRILKTFEQQGLLSLSRGKIELRNWIEKDVVWISPWTEHDPRTGEKPWWI